MLLPILIVQNLKLGSENIFIGSTWELAIWRAFLKLAWRPLMFGKTNTVFQV